MLQIVEKAFSATVLEHQANGRQRFSADRLFVDVVFNKKSLEKNKTWRAVFFEDLCNEGRTMNAVGRGSETMCS